MLSTSAKTRIQTQSKEASCSKDLARSANEQNYVSTLDVIRKLIETEGPSGLYAGLESSLIGVGSTNFVYFYWYSAVRSLYLSSRHHEGAPSTMMELSLGAIAGAIAQIFTIPVSVITTRQQTQNKDERKSLRLTGQEILESEDGWTGLWRGLKASLILVINPAITYGAYERLRLALFNGNRDLQSWEAFGVHPYSARVVSAACS